MVYLFNTLRREQAMLLVKTETMAEARLMLLKELIMLAYETDRDLFHKKFRTAVHIKNLCKTGALEIGHELFHKRTGRHIDVAAKKILTDGDIELCCLLLHGFSSSELTVIYDLKNVQSVYMKRHRLKSKLDSLGVKEIL